MSSEIKFHKNLTKITGILINTNKNFFIISRSVLFRMKDISDRICRENQKTHFVLNNFFLKENFAPYEIMWRNILEPDRPQMTIWRMSIACWIPEATNTY
jgi:hypothetical protein